MFSMLSSPCWTRLPSVRPHAHPCDLRDVFVVSVGRDSVSIVCAANQTLLVGSCIPLALSDSMKRSAVTGPTRTSETYGLSRNALSWSMYCSVR